VDAHVTGFSKHYIIVADDCLRLFADFAGPRRVIIPTSQLLPRWLKNAPRFIQRKNRRYWWSFRAPPVDGWQLQQILKISAACCLPEERYCMLDSDVMFFRPFDLTAYARPELLRLFCQRLAITETLAPFASWVRTAHRLLGIGAASFPADYFITHIVLWDQRSARAMVDRIEAVSGSSWIEALCWAGHGFAEYMLYGRFIMTDEAHAKDHKLSDTSLCISYFDKKPLEQAAVLKLLHQGTSEQVGFSAVARSSTSIDMIRRTLQSEDVSRNRLALH
jgi:hypothetical protein